MSLWEKAELKVERGSDGLHLNLNLSLDLSLQARTYSGFSGFAVSPHSWGDSSVGIVREEPGAYRTRKHGCAQNDFYHGGTL
jgi:hypothetical protein